MSNESAGNPKRKGMTDEMYKRSLGLTDEDRVTLEENFIIVKRKRENRSLFCEVCCSSMQSSGTLWSHLRSQSHIENKIAQHLLASMKYIPPATEAHLSAVSKVLSSVKLSYVDENQLKIYRESGEKICNALEASIPNARFHLKGSVATGLVTQESTLKIDACFQSSPPSSVCSEDRIVPLLTLDGFHLSSLYRSICGLNFIKSSKIEMDRAGHPTINVSDELGVTYVISEGAPCCSHLADLIRTYFSVDDRVKPLVEILVKFSELAGLRKYLTKSVICAMVIFFLQRMSFPVLPNLHQIASEHAEDIPEDAVQKVQCRGENLSYLKDATLVPKYISPGSVDLSLTDLWLRCLRFYAYEFQYRLCAVSIRHSTPLLKTSRKCEKSVLWVEDPFCPNEPIGDRLRADISKYIQDQFVAAYVYYGIPRLLNSDQPFYYRVLVKRKPHNKLNMEATSEAQNQSNLGIEGPVQQGTKVSDNGVKKCVDGDVVPKTPTGAKKESWNTFILTMNSTDFEIRDSDKPGLYNSTKVNSLKESDMSYIFGVGEWSGRKKLPLGCSMVMHPEEPPSFCTFCNHDGHFSNECTSAFESMQSLETLEESVPKTCTPEHLKELSECLRELSTYHISAETTRRRKVAVQNLTDVFRLSYPNILLEMFGSCVNGFETKCSDIDICVMFPEGSEEATSIASRTGIEKFIKDFRKILYRNTNKLLVRSIRPVFNAKVPILKFTMNDFEVDMSFSNQLAVHNSRLLLLYNTLEPRLRILDIALKVVLRLCGVPKSDHGGISSYAYANMLIYYLQRKNYLPVLQELYDVAESPMPTRWVGKWNAWFQEDRAVINRMWKPPNAETSTADLWLGFFRFYLFEFDRTNQIVCIRTKKVITCGSEYRPWKPLLSIQDPFDHCHNLTKVVRRPIINLVLTTFYNVLLLHTTFIQRDLPLSEWKTQLFSSPALRQTLPLADGKRRKNTASQPQMANLLPFHVQVAAGAKEDLGKKPPFKSDTAKSSKNSGRGNNRRQQKRQPFRGAPTDVRPLQANSHLPPPSASPPPPSAGRGNGFSAYHRSHAPRFQDPAQFKHQRGFARMMNHGGNPTDPTPSAHAFLAGPPSHPPLSQTLHLAFRGLSVAHGGQSLNNFSAGAVNRGRGGGVCGSRPRGRAGYSARS